MLSLVERVLHELAWAAAVSGQVLDLADLLDQATARWQLRQVLFEVFRRAGVAVSDVEAALTRLRHDTAEFDRRNVDRDGDLDQDQAGARERRVGHGILACYLSAVVAALAGTRAPGSCTITLAVGLLMALDEATEGCRRASAPQAGST